ncbi:MAG: hypothetical protein GC204_15240 [Chloroflexi bacterium]|nr:hypothetical protein [Chloroflexota bacterium]
METPLTVLYTHNLRGDLDALPRLYAFLRQLKAYYASEEVVQLCALDPAQPPGSTLLLDLGDNCAPDVWHCQVSGGRSTLVVLDGMGYDAARVDDAAGKVEKMGGGVRLALVDDTHPFAFEDVLITAEERRGDLPGRPYSLQIMLSSAENTHLDGARLSLAALDGSQQIGAAQLTKGIGGWALIAHEIHELPRRTLPDPTITAAVEFVVSEARYAQKRRSS